jgi:protein involved in polysaccharide export with SLBB domain
LSLFFVNQLGGIMKVVKKIMIMSLALAMFTALSFTALSFTASSVAVASQLEFVEEPPKPQENNKGYITSSIPEAIKINKESSSESKIVRSDESIIDVVAELKNVKLLPKLEIGKDIGEPTRYTLGPDDVIEIVVRRHPEFSGVYPINAEGKIQYKFVGDIQVSALSKTDVKEKVTQILKKFIINPEVDVVIREYRSKVIYVIGEVGSPGKYYMKADQISVREAVVQAGLPRLSAAMRRTQLIRPDASGKPQVKRMDLYALLYEGKLEIDEYMYSGDVLVVPATFLTKVMRVLNPVTAPISSAQTLRKVGTGGI